jgi:uncharacterized membrane protein
MEVLVVLSRWLHVISAILAIGGAFFMRVVVPPALAEAEAGSREAVLIALRKKFKMVVHICVTLLILTGAFNTWRSWGDYKLKTGVMHGIWGMHMLLGLVVIGISVTLLAKREPPKNHRGMLTVNLVIMFVVVALASTLKFVRDTAVRSKDVAPSAGVDR